MGVVGFCFQNWIIKHMKVVDRIKMSKQCEIIELSTKLSTLKEKGLISDLEYQEIVCCGELVERALLKLLFSKYQLHGANILKLFEVLTAEIPVAAKNEDNRSIQHDDGGKNKQTINPLQEKNKNPLLIDIVIRSVFEFLTFDEIKKCRLVCHQWDSTAQPFLRRKGIIHFQPQSLKPSMFLEEMEDNLPELPFTSFKFSNVESNILWSVSQLQKFFDNWGRNIKHLELLNICLGNQRQFDVTPWLEKATSLTKLTIKCNRGNSGRLNSHGRPDMDTPLQIQLDKLKSVKYLHLNGQGILICLSNKNMIGPLEINLNEVLFKETAPVGLVTDVALVLLNNYIDFSQAKKIFLTPCANKFTNFAAFDMANQDFNAQSVVLNNIEILNWNKAKGKIDCLTLIGTKLTEWNELEVTKFVLDSCTIDMAIIPLTIEQIHFVNKRTEIICDHSIVLPKLVSLAFKNVTQRSLNMMSRFACCNNLVELEIEKQSENLCLTLMVSMIPKSVKRMKISNIIFERDNDCVTCTMDKLILGESLFSHFLVGLSAMLSAVLKLNLKVLVIDAAFLNLSSSTLATRYEFTMTNFIQDNQHLEKIIVGNLETLFGLIPFEGSGFSRCVDRKSNYYEFEKNNAMGKSITSCQFSLWKSLNALTLD